MFKAPTSKRQVVIILKDKMKTDFMQMSGVFEHFKVLVKYQVATVVDDFGQSHVDEIQKTVNGSSVFELVAIYNDAIVYYRDPSVTVVSDGIKWCVLDDLLPKKE